MIPCSNCGAPVSDRFALVLGTETKKVHACPSCSTREERMRGAAAGKDVSELSRP